MSGVAEAATAVDRAPSAAQVSAGNYRKGHVRLNGFDFTIETVAGERRAPHFPPLSNHYGYVCRTLGADGDQVDVFLGPGAADATLPVFVVDQVNERGVFDEHKVMYGFRDRYAARQAYFDNYWLGWNGLGAMTQLTQQQFAAWLFDGDTTAPASLGKAAKPVKGAALKLSQIAGRTDEEAALRRAFAAALATVRRSVARQLPGLIRKVIKASDARVQQILDELDMSGFSVLMDDEDLKAAIARILRKVGARELKQLKLAADEADGITDQVNVDASNFADAYGAELVGKRILSDGTLINNPSAYWRIDESTREMLRSLVSDAIDDGWSTGHLEKEVSDAAAFSDYRSEMIARTELARAEGIGKMMAWRRSGVVKRKRWLLDDDPCDICENNALQGPIKLDEPFESGDDAEPAHPHCRCAVVAETEEDPNED